MSSTAAAQTQRRLANNFIQGYNDFTIESILAPRAEEREHHMLPANLQRPVRTNVDYAKFFDVLKEHMMTSHRIVNDPDEKTIAVYATGSAGTPWAPYENSYVFFLTCDVEREVIVRVDEFVDSKFSEESFERMREFLGGKG